MSNKNENTTQESSLTTLRDETQIPKPFGVFNHPYLSWKDVVLCYMIPFIADFSPLDNEALDPHSEESRQILGKLRKQLQDMAEGPIGKAAVKKWSDAAAGCQLAEYKGEIPFQKHILKDWGILSKNSDENVLPEEVASRECVKVLVRFPSSMLSAEERKNARTLRYSGCLEVKELHLTEFGKDAPFMLQFHGGGLVMGSAYRETLLYETAELVSTFSKQNSTDPPEIVTISIEYGLAPDHRFPVAIMDALSVVDYLFASNPSRKIHTSGESAGANISLVTGLEAFRRYPGRVLSIHSQCPMMKPTGDTMSDYMNQHIFPGNVFLRWCWRAYLDFDAPETSRHTSPHTTKEALQNGSNCTAWEDWKCKFSPSIQRLVDPSIDLPANLDSVDAPQLFLRINMGDPLHDDGKEGISSLAKAKTVVTSFSDKGLHCSLGGSYDREGHERFLIQWSNAVFGSKDDSAT